MSDVTDLAVAASAISDPATPAEDLAVIAGTHPSLRTAVVFHPNVYPGLLDWLDALGDPNLSRAVAARRSTDAQQMPYSYPQASPLPQESPYPQAYETAFASTNVVGGMDANATGMTVGTLTSGRPAPDSTVIAAPPNDVPMDEYAAPYTPRTPKGAAIAAGILFLAGAAMAGWQFVLGTFTFCGLYDHNSWDWYPWGWMDGFSYWCYFNGRSEYWVANVFSMIAVAALIGCGVVSLVVGRKNIRTATFSIGMILSGVTAVSTVVASVGIVQIHRDIMTNALVTNGAADISFFALLVILLPMAKSSSYRLLQWLRAMVIVLCGIVFFSRVYPYRNPFGILVPNLGNIPFFAALFVLAFALPIPSSRETAVARGNNLLLVSSAVALASGMNYLISFISMWSLVHHPDFSLYDIRGVYLIITGILGLASLGHRRRFVLLLVVGIGLVAAQGIRVIGWYQSAQYHQLWFSTVMPDLFFIIMAVLYIVGAANLRKDPAKRVAMQPVGQPYPGQPYPGQPYNGVYDAPSGGYAVLGFFVPVVGLILYLVWKDQTPLRAKSAGKGAIIGVIADVVVPILIYVVFFVILYSAVHY